MLNLEKPVTFDDLAMFSAADLIKRIQTFCSRGSNMHPDSLQAVVLKLTMLSRDMQLKQTERDNSADLASILANAAVKSYGAHSEYCQQLVAGIRSIVARPA